jgi:hypothetical protein
VQEEIVPEENTYRITVCQNNSRAKKNKNGKRRTMMILQSRIQKKR